VINRKDTNEFNMNFDYKKKSLNKTIKYDAAILVNLNGKNCDFENINSGKKNYIIEDCAQSFLSFRKKKYLTSWIIFLVSPLVQQNLMNTFQGGFCTTNNKNLYKKLIINKKSWCL
jgi:dTDP-4-amino-4,6-dideoxygalactose transaminase